MKKMILFLLFLALSASSLHAQIAPTLTVEGLGKGSLALDGPWQFHLGDDPAFASPALNDATGQTGWEQISADETWGAQGHRSYQGYAWYRIHLHLTPAPGASPDFALLIPEIDDVYQIYWNGVLVAHNGKMPPYPSWRESQPARVFHLGPLRDGVLAVRVWAKPLFSYEDGLRGGMIGAPLIGGPAAIASRKAASDYMWLRQNLYFFGLQSLYAVLLVLGLSVWLRDRSQQVLLWMAVFYGGALAATLLQGWRLPITFQTSYASEQIALGIRDVGLWFFLLWLLKMNENARLVRLTKVLFVIYFLDFLTDGVLSFFNLGAPRIAVRVQIIDALLTPIFMVMELYPLALIVIALRNRLDFPRWAVAIFAFLVEMIEVYHDIFEQGSRFTHWNFANVLQSPLFTIYGSPFSARTLASTGLLLAIIYAVYRYSRETIQRQQRMEQELRNAQEMQQLLIPAAPPATPGFSVETVYLPASEVGGDFFHIQPSSDGSLLIITGDVSGKGLKAAMTVSTIIGALRNEKERQPANVLSNLNHALHGNITGFAVCTAALISASGEMALANAGNLAPYLNGKELTLESGLPLGVIADSTYPETIHQLHPNDRLTFVSDGVVEATDPNKTLFGFDRTQSISTQSASAIAQVAQSFGQQDDISVVAITRTVTAKPAVA